MHLVAPKISSELVLFFYTIWHHGRQMSVTDSTMY